MKINAASRLQALQAHAEYWMSNLRDDKTGLPGGIFVWVSTKGGAQHGPRIKVSKVRGHFAEGEDFSIVVGPSPYIVEGTSDFSPLENAALFLWTKLNEAHLAEFWHSTTMDSDDIKKRLKKLPRNWKALTKAPG